MNIFHIDPMDGELPISVAVANESDALRIISFVLKATKTIQRMNAEDEARQVADAIYGRVK